MKRYGLYWAQLDPTQGSETAKTRPVVVVSRDELNSVLRTVTICPLTSQLHPHWKTRLIVSVGGRDSEIAVDQIRTVSTSRLGDCLGQLDEVQSAHLRRLLGELYAEE